MLSYFQYSTEQVNAIASQYMIFMDNTSGSLAKNIRDQVLRERNDPNFSVLDINKEIMLSNKTVLTTNQGELYTKQQGHILTQMALHDAIKHLSGESAWQDSGDWVSYFNEILDPFTKEDVPERFITPDDFSTPRLVEIANIFKGMTPKQMEAIGQTILSKYENEYNLTPILERNTTDIVDVTIEQRNAVMQLALSELPKNISEGWNWTPMWLSHLDDLDPDIDVTDLPEKTLMDALQILDPKRNDKVNWTASDWQTWNTFSVIAMAKELYQNYDKERGIQSISLESPVKEKTISRGR